MTDLSDLIEELIRPSLEKTKAKVPIKVVITQWRDD
jgi:hypothetical protein